MTAFVDSVRTATGLTLREAFAKLDAPLDRRAYKRISGGKGEKIGLTDIGPAYLNETLLAVFGPLGYGWGFSIEDVTTVEGKNRSGNVEFRARCKVSVWWKFFQEVPQGHTIGVKSDPIVAHGASDNSELEWAEKGAVTNALGNAWSYAGWQLSVYKGLRSHAKDETIVEEEDPGDPTEKVHVIDGKTGEDKGTRPKLSDAQSKKIHALRRDLGLSDDDYRERLKRKFAKDSTDQLSVDEASVVIESLERSRRQYGTAAEKAEKKLARFEQAQTEIHAEVERLEAEK